MDDTYLKIVFWSIVILYTVAIIGIWENLAKPLWGLLYFYAGPWIMYLLANMGIK